jgi:predicted ATP-binding protein involved in virulence
VLILTGANGFGKTQILNIIYHLFSRNFLFFKKLVFNKIAITLEENFFIEVTKKDDDIVFALHQKGKEVDKFSYKELKNENINTISGDIVIYHHNHTEDILQETLDDNEVLKRHFGQHSEVFKEVYNFNDYKVFDDFLDSINVHLIQEQRLFTKINKEDEYSRFRKRNVVVETIKTYAEELKDLIEEKYEESLKITQQLDNSYPGRLISEKNKISEDDYNKRFAELNTKQERLTKNGLYESKQEALEYSADDAKALLVYLDDLEKKLNVFDDLLEKLDLFTSILNERRFTYKTIHIDSEKGFYFKTSKDKELELGELSSGEQHEVVLLYELIFNTAPNNMVLIDEPEISLHVAWQKEFVKDLLKIIELQGFQVMMATHSPSIINDRWDLVHVLEKKEEA